MIISKDLFIFGEHIFATIIPEVQAQSIPLQQQQTIQLEIGEKSVDPQKKLVVEDIQTETLDGGGGRGSLSQKETVAVVIVASASSPSTGKLTTTSTTKLNKIPDQPLLSKEVEQNLELKEKQQQQNHIKSNGSIKIIKTTTITNHKAETGSIEGKKLTFQQNQKKAKETTVEDKETEAYNKVRRPKEKLLVAEDNTNTNSYNGNKDITEEETTAIEEEEEQISAEQQPLVQGNFTNNKLKIVSSSQQVEAENPLVSTNNIQDNNTR